MKRKLRVRKFSTDCLFDLVDRGEWQETLRLISLYPQSLEARNDVGFTPLLWAIRHKQTELSHQLLRKGANPNVQANGGQTCLMWACHHGDVSILQDLLTHGLDLNAVSDVSDWDDYWEEDNRDEFVLEIVISHWLSDDHLFSLLDFFEQYEHLMTEEVKKQYKKARLLRITKNQ